MGRGPSSVSAAGGISPWVFGPCREREMSETTVPAAHGLITLGRIRAETIASGRTRSFEFGGSNIVMGLWIGQILPVLIFLSFSRVPVLGAEIGEKKTMPRLCLLGIHNEADDARLLLPSLLAHGVRKSMGIDCFSLLLHWVACKKRVECFSTLCVTSQAKKVDPTVVYLHEACQMEGVASACLLRNTGSQVGCATQTNSSPAQGIVENIVALDGPSASRRLEAKADAGMMSIPDPRQARSLFNRNFNRP
ncbi:hypothetical protein MRB53_006135 [Persea americana]|uniref:Uncharacterized protein n=1 Tax=Persea americana TaxID=3435 RepID=A0ACC2MGU3_PERAE|nr:hypothetical protein MRB53_006135 [Persea americana]